MLKNKASAVKEPMAWQKAESEDTVKNINIIDVPTLSYSNNNQDQIDITYLIHRDWDEDAALLLAKSISLA